MSQIRGSSCLRYIAVMIGVVCLAGMLHAQVSMPTAYELNYYNNSNPVPDSTFHVVNPGYQVSTINFNGKPLNGDMCAMLYVYNNDEELEECCGCLVTPDSELTLSLNKDLLKNPVNGTVVTSHGVVKLISATPQYNSTTDTYYCDPTGEILPSEPVVPKPELPAWATHTLRFNTQYPEAELRFQYATLNDYELEFDENNCSTIVFNGSKTGICTCGYGD